MNNKILKNVKKVVITCMIMVLCSPYAVSAFGGNSNEGGNFLKNLIDGFVESLSQYTETTITSEELLTYLQGINIESLIGLTEEELMAKIEEIKQKVATLDNEELQKILDEMIASVNIEELDIEELKAFVQDLINKVKEFIQEIPVKTPTEDPEDDPEEDPEDDPEDDPKDDPEKDQEQKPKKESFWDIFARIFKRK